MQYLHQINANVDHTVKSIEEHINFHSQALALRSRRNEILASNIANAATPNFKAKDLNFNEMLMVKLEMGDLKVSNPGHMNVVIGTNEEGIGFRQNITPSKDGNTVELHVEQMQFSENVIRYQTSLEFLNRKISGLRSAIKGE